MNQITSNVLNVPFKKLEKNSSSSQRLIYTRGNDLQFSWISFHHKLFFPPVQTCRSRPAVRAPGWRVGIPGRTHCALTRPSGVCTAPVGPDVASH